MDNKLIVERVFQLEAAIRYKNTILASALRRAILPLLEYRHSLSTVTHKTLLALDGVDRAAVPYIQRVIAGEDLEAIAANVPERKRHTSTGGGGSRVPDSGDWDGSWDNIVRIIEDWSPARKDD